MEKTIVMVPFVDGDQENVKKIVEMVKSELKGKDYIIYTVGPSIDINEGKRTFVIKEIVRKGKSYWIRKIIQREKGIFFEISGDVLPSRGFFRKALKHFNDDDVGMVCGRVVPFKADNIVYKLSETIWLLCDEISRIRPKGSEAIVFKTSLVKNFHTRVVADESYIEANVNRSGKRIVYDRSIVIRNKAPLDLSDLFSQRIRYHIGHLQVKKETGYIPVTMDAFSLLKACANFLSKYPKKIPFLVLMFLLEIAARIYALLLFKTNKLPYKWKLAKRS